MKRLGGEPATRDHANVAVQYVPNTGSVNVETVVQKGRSLLWYLHWRREEASKFLYSGSLYQSKCPKESLLKFWPITYQYHLRPTCMQWQRYGGYFNNNFTFIKMEKFLSHSILVKISHVLEPFATPNGKRQFFGRFHSAVWANELSKAALCLDSYLCFLPTDP